MNALSVKVGKWRRTDWIYHSIRQYPFGIRSFISHLESTYRCYWIELWGFGKTIVLIWEPKETK